MTTHSVNSRLVALTDGVVTIAMTLLVLDIRLPASVMNSHVRWADLLAIREQVLSYAISFVVIAILWLSHAKKFRNLARFTGTLFWLNTLFLLAVGLIPFTASLLAASGNGLATRVYAGALAIASASLALMSIHVRTAGLARPDGEKQRLRLISLMQFAWTAVFLISIAVSFWSASWARWTWMLLIPLALVPDRLTEDPRDA